MRLKHSTGIKLEKMGAHPMSGQRARSIRARCLSLDVKYIIEFVVKLPAAPWRSDGTMAHGLEKATISDENIIAMRDGKIVKARSTVLKPESESWITEHVQNIKLGPSGHRLRYQQEEGEQGEQSAFRPSDRGDVDRRDGLEVEDPVVYAYKPEIC